MIRHYSHRILVFGDYDGTYCASITRCYATYSSSIVMSLIMNHVLVTYFFFTHVQAWIVTMLWTVRPCRPYHTYIHRLCSHIITTVTLPYPLLMLHAHPCMHACIVCMYDPTTTTTFRAYSIISCCGLRGEGQTRRTLRRARTRRRSETATPCSERTPYFCIFCTYSM